MPKTPRPLFKWSPRLTPNAISTNYLFAASASSPSDIWAVGTTAIHYDGTSWTGYPLPYIKGAIGSELEGVAVISPTDAWAVGTYKTSQTTTGNLQHWDGSKWSPVPNAAAGGIVWSMAAVAAHDIWAGGCIPAFFEHFDGTQWTVVPSGGSGGVDNESCVQAISVSSSDDVWAAGWTQSGRNIYSTQIQHWDGTQWTETPSPNVGAGSNQLYGLVALADDNVWAVGYSVAPEHGIEKPDRTLIEHWDGASWGVVPSPNVDYGNMARDNVLRGIVALSPNDIFAFGWYAANPSGESGDEFTLVLHWDGTSWSVVPTPDPTGDPTLVNDPLYAGVVTAPGHVWIFGSEQQLPGNFPNPDTTTLVLLHTARQ